MLPWSEMDTLHLETGTIKDALIALNRRGFLTINSQPQVNGKPSTDPQVGWGGPNGYSPSIHPGILHFMIVWRPCALRFSWYNAS